jgi:hypothetical protein
MHKGVSHLLGGILVKKQQKKFLHLKVAQSGKAQ